MIFVLYLYLLWSNYSCIVLLKSALRNIEVVLSLFDEHGRALLRLLLEDHTRALSHAPCEDIVAHVCHCPGTFLSK